jgi:hypothetical protein
MPPKKRMSEPLTRAAARKVHESARQFPRSRQLGSYDPVFFFDQNPVYQKPANVGRQIANITAEALEALEIHILAQGRLGRLSPTYRKRLWEFKKKYGKDPWKYGK